MAKRPAHKVDFDSLAEGDYLSRCVYYKVRKVDHDAKTAVLVNEDDFPFEVTQKIPEQEMYSCSQVKETVKVNRTQLVDILMSAGNTIFTVEFLKQLKPEEVASALREASHLDRMSMAQLKHYCKDTLLKGQHRKLIGYLINTEPALGRSKVHDMEVEKGQYAERLVDHRTLESILIRGVKYHV